MWFDVPKQISQIFFLVIAAHHAMRVVQKIKVTIWINSIN